MVLRREGDRFLAERVVAGWFVPLLGSGQQRAELHGSLGKDGVRGAPSTRAPLPLCVGQMGLPSAR